MSKICVCILPLLMLLFLGTWQVSRLREKLQIVSAMQAAAVVLSPHGNLQDNAHKKVRVFGAFKPDHFSVFAGRKGNYLLQLFRISDGRYVLVNRGTSAGHEQLEFPDNTVEKYVSGTVYCRLDSKAKWVATNDASKNLWFWFDIKSMSEHIQVQLEPCIIWGDRTTVFPRLEPNVELKVRNDHLEYAITWYVLAAVWLCGCIIFHRKRAANEY